MVATGPVLGVDDLVGRGAFAGGRRSSQPSCQRDRGVHSREPLGELYREGFGVRPLLEHLDHGGRLRLRSAARAQLHVGHGVCVIPRDAARGHALRESPEILHEHEAKRDRQGPQLPDRERLHALIGPDESAKRLELDAAVGMRHELPGEPVNAGRILELAVGKLGQLAIETGREILLDLANLLLDDVKIVQQPLGARRDRAGLAARLRDQPVRMHQDPGVFAQPRQKPPAAAFSRMDVMLGRESPRELLEVLGREELRPNGRFGRSHHALLNAKKAEPHAGSAVNRRE
jgi:hypothetical protein